MQCRFFLKVDFYFNRKSYHYMSITAIFANSSFDNEIRIDCNELRMNTKKDGEICILPNFNNAIFEVENCIINILSNGKTIKIKIINSAILQFNNNLLHCFGNFEQIKDDIQNKI